MERKLQEFSESSLSTQEIGASEKTTQGKEKNNLVKNGVCFYQPGWNISEFIALGRVLEV